VKRLLIWVGCQICCLWRHCASGAETSCRTLSCGIVLQDAACEAPTYLGGLLLDTREQRTRGVVQDAASLSSACLSAEASGASPRKRLNGHLCSRPLQPALQPALLSPRKLVSPDMLPIWRVIAQAGQKLCAGRCPSGLSFRTLHVKRLLICRGLRSLLCSQVPESL